MRTTWLRVEKKILYGEPCFKTQTGQREYVLHHFLGPKQLTSSAAIFYKPLTDISLPPNTHSLTDAQLIHPHHGNWSRGARLLFNQTSKGWLQIPLGRLLLHNRRECWDNNVNTGRRLLRRNSQELKILTQLNICIVSSVNCAADVINMAEQKQAGNHFRIRGGSVH